MTIQSHRGKSGDNLPDPEWPKMALHRKSALLTGQSNELDHQKCDEALLKTKNAGGGTRARFSRFPFPLPHPRACPHLFSTSMSAPGNTPVPGLPCEFYITLSTRRKEKRSSPSTKLSPPSFIFPSFRFLYFQQVPLTSHID